MGRCRQTPRGSYECQTIRQTNIGSKHLIHSRMSNGNAAAAAAGTSQRHHSEQTFDATSQIDETGTTATTTSECSPIDGGSANQNLATGTTDEGQSTVSARHQNRTGHNHNRSTTIRHSSAYVRNYRLSRYRNALKGALPFRLNTMRSVG